jgi:hypothetical protein
VQEEQGVAAGRSGAGVHLNRSGRSGRQGSNAGRPGDGEGGIGAAAVDHDDLDAPVRGEGREGFRQLAGLVQGRYDHRERRRVNAAAERSKRRRNVGRVVDVGERREQRAGQARFARPGQRPGEHVGRPPGDAWPQKGAAAPEGRGGRADQVIAAVKGRPEHQVVTAQGVEGPGEARGGECRDVRPDEDRTRRAFLKGGPEGGFHAGAEVPLPLRAVAESVPQPLPHAGSAAARMPDFQRQPALSPGGSGRPDRVLGQPSLEGRGTLRAQHRNQASLGGARLGIAGEKNESVRRCAHG